MCAGEAVSFGTEYDKHSNALAPRNERHRAIGSNPLFHIGLFDLKLNLSLQISPHEWLLMLKHPAVVARFRVEYETYLIEAIRSLPIGSGQPQCSVLGCIQAKSHAVVGNDLLHGSACPPEDFADARLGDCCSVNFQYRRIPCCRS